MSLDKVVYRYSMSPLYPSCPWPPCVISPWNQISQQEEFLPQPKYHSHLEHKFQQCSETIQHSARNQGRPCDLLN
ncbi:unnamed protein product [Rodentolepis nana]|uniref:Ovule protein n=1 Tax=Rodentolepis nana TaxID=102285 RepID=A0A0R3TSF9_RODNA|nr:unnamed protein product [Rodentolepis nana]